MNICSVCGAGYHGEGWHCPPPMKCLRGHYLDYYNGFVPCENERWEHPTEGMLCLCQEHAEEVFRGEAKAPPLRKNIDYYSPGRKTFLVEKI